MYGRSGCGQRSESLPEKPLAPDGQPYTLEATGAKAIVDMQMNGGMPGVTCAEPADRIASEHGGRLASADQTDSAGLFISGVTRDGARTDATAPG